MPDTSFTGNNTQKIDQLIGAVTQLERQIDKLPSQFEKVSDSVTSGLQGVRLEYARDLQGVALAQTEVASSLKGLNERIGQHAAEIEKRFQILIDGIDKRFGQLQWIIGIACGVIVLVMGFSINSTNHLALKVGNIEGQLASIPQKLDDIARSLAAREQAGRPQLPIQNTANQQPEPFAVQEAKPVSWQWSIDKDNIHDRDGRLWYTIPQNSPYYVQVQHFIRKYQSIDGIVRFSDEQTSATVLKHMGGSRPFVYVCLNKPSSQVEASYLEFTLDDVARKQFLMCLQKGPVMVDAVFVPGSQKPEPPVKTGHEE